MATYRVISIVPTAATLPGDGSPTVADEADVVLATNTAAQFPADMDRHSAGMCAIDLSVLVLAEALPSSVYTTQSDQEIIGPILLATHLGIVGEYDGVMVYSPTALTTATTFRGLGGTTSGTPWGWVKVGTGDEPAIAVHEWGHAMTVYLGTTMGTYTNFPSCGAGIPAIHCGEEYGFADDLDPAWLDGFFQGTLSDGTGINATGWAVSTPTETGAKTLASYREFAQPWGTLGALPVTVPGGGD